MKKTLEYKIFNVVACVFTTLFALFCLLPMVLTLVASFATDVELAEKGITLILENPTLAAYRSILNDGGKLARAYAVTIGVTVIGTVLGVYLTTMTSYVLYRRDFPARGFFAFFFYFTTLFSGGLVGNYFVRTRLGLRDTYAVLILSGLVSNFYIIMCRSYMTSNVTQSLVEAAKIDGAGEYRTFFQITLPLLKPSMAAVGFMMATAYWNDWQNALLYISSDNKKPLQLLLVNIQKSIEFLLNNSNVPAAARAAMGGNIPQYSATMATVVAVIAPIMVVYPFFQKYFVKGLTVGSVKG